MLDPIVFHDGAAPLYIHRGAHFGNLCHKVIRDTEKINKINDRLNYNAKDKPIRFQINSILLAMLIIF
jgi:hypothetical protein